jgi:Fe-S cluster assembly ATPase SufC
MHSFFDSRTTKSKSTSVVKNWIHSSLRIFLKERAKVVEMEASFMTRSVNEGFSGGEKKRNEILQMAVLEPKLAVLGRNRLRIGH